VTVWEVFARQAYEEPLHHVGAVTEEDEDLALVSARSIYDEQPWIEMIIVPAQRDPGGDPLVSAAMASAGRVARRQQGRAGAAATPSGRCSAPRLESAVAGRGDGQDELGHARSTVPGAQVARRRARRRRAQPACAARRRAARLDRVRRRQPARRTAC
jgi:hypothetical protein